MRIEVYKCPDCEEEIYSRANHDYIECKCGGLGLDDGHFADTKRAGYIWQPFRIIGKVEAKSRIIELEVTEKQLYDDWNEHGGKYGRL